MNFHFNTFNHCEDGRRCIEDLTRILSSQLRELGHQTSESSQYEDISDENSDTLNVLYESFADPFTLEMIRSAFFLGSRFIYIATEEPTPSGTFNGRLDNAMDARQAIFPDAARYAETIWHLAPGSHITNWYGKFAPAAYVELGFAQELLFVGEDYPVPEFDYGFYGQLTPRRQSIINKIGGTWYILPFIKLSAAERDTEMRRCCVIPQIRAHDSQGIISSSRCATALHMGRPVVAEPHVHSGEWKEVIDFSDSVESFYNDVRKVKDDWQDHYCAQLDRFRKRFSPDFCLGAALAL
jgi:hypothetical protein